MSSDDEKRQIELELLAADLRLRRKQEFWETPRNVAILVGVTAAIAAAIGFWFGRESGPPAPAARPVGVDIFDTMTRGEFIDAVQTAGILVMAFMVVYVVVRFDRTLTAAAEKLKSALAAQHALQQGIERAWQRVEAVETMVLERNAILPTPTLKSTLKDIQRRLDALEVKDESSPIDH